MPCELYDVPPDGVSKLKKKMLLRGLSALLVVYLAFAGLIVWGMYQPPEIFARIMSHMPSAVFLMLPFETLWTQARAGQIKVGDAAPDFSLLKLDKSERVQLSELTSKQPVVLVFGSYT